MSRQDDFSHPDNHVIFNTSRLRIGRAVREIKAFAFDFDGVFTDNCDYITGDASMVFKKRSHTDGQGLSLLRAIEMKILVITGESGPYAQPAINLIEKWNNLDSVRSGAWSRVAIETGASKDQKFELTKEWLLRQNLGWEDCCAMGDDLTELPILKSAALSVAPISADGFVKERVDIITRRAGGDGAVRDLANFFLVLRKVDPGTLALR